MRGKKGEERILSIWWILIIAIIGVFISIGVIIFYSYFLDVRGGEAEILAVRVADCLIENGFLDVDLKKLDREVILTKCNLNGEILKNKYYVNVSFFDINSEPEESVDIGNRDFEVYCKLKGENYPICSEKNLFVLEKKDGEVEKLRIRILTASNNQGRRLG